MPLHRIFTYLLIAFLSASAVHADESDVPPNAEPSDGLERVRAIEAKLDRDLERRVTRSVAAQHPGDHVRELEDAYQRAVAAATPPVSAPPAMPQP